MYRHIITNSFKFNMIFIQSYYVCINIVAWLFLILLRLYWEMLIICILRFYYEFIVGYDFIIFYNVVTMTLFWFIMILNLSYCKYELRMYYDCIRNWHRLIMFLITLYWAFVLNLVYLLWSCYVFIMNYDFTRIVFCFYIEFIWILWF